MSCAAGGASCGGPENRAGRVVAGAAGGGPEGRGLAVGGGLAPSGSESHGRGSRARARLRLRARARDPICERALGKMVGDGIVLELLHSSDASIVKEIADLTWSSSASTTGAPSSSRSLVIAHAGDGNFHTIILFDPSQENQRKEARRHLCFCPDADDIVGFDLAHQGVVHPWLAVKSIGIPGSKQ